MESLKKSQVLMPMLKAALSTSGVSVHAVERNKLGGNEDVSTWMDRENLYFHDKVILMAFIITEKR